MAAPVNLSTTSITATSARFNWESEIDGVQFVASTETEYVTGTSISATIPPETEEGDTIVAVLMRRSSVTNPSGYETIIEQQTTKNNSTVDQWIRLLKKTAESSDAGSPLTITQSSSGRMGLAIIVLRNTSGWESSGGLFGNSAPELPVFGDRRISLTAASNIVAIVSGGTTISVDGDWVLRTTETIDQNRMGAATLDVDESGAPSSSWSSDVSKDDVPSDDWGAVSVVFRPLGGADSDGYEYQVFGSSGTWDWTAAGQPSEVDVLVVAGGGGGGSRQGGGGGGGTCGGGGGGGGYKWETGRAVSASVSIVIGGGGAGGAAVSSADDISGNGSKGTDSSFGALGAEGGGFGQGGAQSSGGGGAGGSGGGGGGIISGSARPGGAGTSGQGNNGGSGGSDTTADNRTGGGGGGASQVGQAGSTTKPGDGGDGIDMSTELGTSVGDNGWFSGGGAGGKRSGGAGGATGGEGGGADEAYEASGIAGAANTGGGGGSSSNVQPGGPGGSGIVIVRWIRP